MANMENEHKVNQQLNQDRADLLSRGDLTDPYPDTLSVAERITASEAYNLYSVRTNIPRGYLWGRQQPHEYTRSPEYRIKSLLFQMGKELLETKPVWAVLNPTSTGDQELVIVDGHKRTRYSALFGIREIPTEILDLDHLASAWEQTPEELNFELRKQTDRAQWDFAAITRAKGKPISAPYHLPGNLKAADLPLYFQNLERPTQTQMQPNQTYVLHGRR